MTCRPGLLSEPESRPIRDAAGTTTATTAQVTPRLGCRLFGGRPRGHCEPRRFARCPPRPRRPAVMRRPPRSTGHGVRVAMRDAPLTLLAAVDLRGPQRVGARLAVDGSRGVLQADGIGHVADHVVRER